VTTGEYPLLYVFGIFVARTVHISGEDDGDREVFFFEGAGFV
jgi:hypothetical protein